MTSPSGVPPHQDPTPNPHSDRVTALEYLTTLISTLDRRFDTAHEDLKASIIDRFTAIRVLVDANDLRYQQRFDAANEAVHAALVAAEKATTKAEAAADKRFESVNEFRAQLADQAATFIPRAESEARMRSLAELVEAKYAGLLDKISDLTETVNRAQGRSAGLGAGWNYLVGLVGLVVAVITIVGVVVGTR